jgi:hypothetical protein
MRIQVNEDGRISINARIHYLPFPSARQQKGGVFLRQLAIDFQFQIISQNLFCGNSASSIQNGVPVLGSTIQSG